VALRPDGKWTVAVCSHSGRDSGTRFWKKKSPVMPSFQRFEHGRAVVEPRTQASLTER